MNTNEMKGTCPGSFSINEWVFAQPGPMLRDILGQLIEKYPELDIDIQQMMKIARTATACRSSE